MSLSPTIHASAVLIGASAVLIQGPSGSGKSRLAMALLEAAQRGSLRFARLVGDDRVHIEARHGRLVIRPAGPLAGLIEVRGLGIRQVAHEPVAVAGLVVELGVENAKRLPARGQQCVEIEGISLPRLAVPPGRDPLPLVLAWLQTTPRVG